jgi:hypothetical protein
VSTTLKQGTNFLFKCELNDDDNVDAPLTSGALQIGSIYQLLTYVTGDDFVNVGGENASGTEFTATGTTPTDWSHGSTLQQIQKTPITADQILDVEVIAHQVDKILKTWTKKSAFMEITDGLVRVEVSKAVSKTWLGDIEFKVSPSFVEPDYFNSGAQTDVACFPDLLTIEKC